MKRGFYYILPIVVLVLTIVLEPFYALDMFLCDNLYKRLGTPSPEIKMITIEEETLEQYGNFNLWSRKKTAELVNLLSADKETAPAVIALDIMFTGEYEAEADHALSKACKEAGNVVVATNLVYRGTTMQDEQGRYYFDADYIAAEEGVYEELTEYVTPGYSNTYISEDGYIRYTKPVTEFNKEKRESLSYSIYRMYQEGRGEVAKMPATNAGGQCQFFYTGVSGDFAHFSIEDVLDGRIPLSEFEDCIVLVGAYAPGFQDAYGVGVDRGRVMYGVEINANMVQAFLDGKTAVPVNPWVHALIGAAVLAVFLWIAGKQKLGFVLAEAVFLIVLHGLAGRLLAAGGLTISQVYFIGTMVLLGIYFVVEKYVLERMKRKHTLDTFKKYVAPQVVERLSKTGNFELHLGGEKRDIAVLFVDIRGFTPMSENLSPEQVVAILNEYLALTTASIHKHNGTLDKFIGDATMAVFNAPFDLEDYVYAAVCAAWSIRQGSEELSKKLMEKFGKTVSFGIGVNCGEAVVGNIGCEFRMDYTAIGDTVNTAARLESNAKPGEILISEAVCRALEGRITVEEVGELSLKGKQKAVKTYRVVSVPEQG